MKRKNNKRKFEDKVHKKVIRSDDRRKTKSERHTTKDFLHSIGKVNDLDNQDVRDIMDELENTEWSD